MPALRRKQELKKDPGQPRLCKRFKDSLDGEALKRDRTIQRDSDISTQRRGRIPQDQPRWVPRTKPEPCLLFNGGGGGAGAGLGGGNLQEPGMVAHICNSSKSKTIVLCSKPALGSEEDPSSRNKTQETGTMAQWSEHLLCKPEGLS